MALYGFSWWNVGQHDSRERSEEGVSSNQWKNAPALDEILSIKTPQRSNFCRWNICAWPHQHPFRRPDHQREFWLLSQACAEASFQKATSKSSTRRRQKCQVALWQCTRAQVAGHSPVYGGERLQNILASDWPRNSPDLSPMDYSINGIFKRRLWKRKARGLEGLVRVLKEEWSGISIKFCVNTIESWSTGTSRVLKYPGYQNEHLSKRRCWQDMLSQVCVNGLCMMSFPVRALYNGGNVNGIICVQFITTIADSDSPTACISSWTIVPWWTQPEGNTINGAISFSVPEISQCVQLPWSCLSSL